MAIESSAEAGRPIWSTVVISSSTGSPGPTSGLTGATVTFRSRSTSTSSLAWSNVFSHIRAAVRVKLGN